MTSDQAGPDPQQISNLTDLAQALSALRRRQARKGQLQLSVRDLARSTGRAPSTLHPYLSGRRLCPADVYEQLLHALAVPASQLRPWLDAWERLADTGAIQPPRSVQASPPPGGRRPPDIVARTETIRYQVLPDGRTTRSWISIVTGDLRRIAHAADVWVNSENTLMQMSRMDDHSISAAIRSEGAARDHLGHVIADPIGAELARRVADGAPVAPATAVTTGAGALTERYGVRYVIHVASVQGEPGDGYRQILNVGRCVTNALAEAERLGIGDNPVRTVLIPLLGAGVGGADAAPTITSLLEAAINHLTTRRVDRNVREVFLLAFTQRELDACLTIFNAHPRLRSDRQRPRPPDGSSQPK